MIHRVSSLLLRAFFYGVTGYTIGYLAYAIALCCNWPVPGASQ